MPKSWFDSLTPSQRSAYSYVRRGVKEDLTIARIGAIIRKDGRAISNSVLSKMVNAERAIKEHVSNLRNLGPNRLPNPFKLPQALTRIPRQYSIEVKINSVLTSTGKQSSIYATITSDSLLSNRAIESAVDKIMSSRGERYGFERESFEVTGYMRAGSEGFGF